LRLAWSPLRCFAQHSSLIAQPFSFFWSRRFLEASKDKKTGASIAQDFEARTALRNFARAQRMAEILQVKLARNQVRT
jgi:hypothetical protein